MYKSTLFLLYGQEKKTFFLGNMCFTARVIGLKHEIRQKYRIYKYLYASFQSFSDTFLSLKRLIFKNIYISLLPGIAYKSD